MTANMREDVTIKQYDVWSWFYDRTFGALVTRRQLRALEQLRAKPGDRVLDLGVGTGLTLRHYPQDVTVVGVDLSMGMLKKADLKRRQHDLSHCHLIQADAMMPPFADESFDHVVITHVISVVSNPPRLLQLAQRLVKPGGRIVVLNHFQSTQPVVAWVEKVLNPIFLRIGWKSDLAMEDVLRGVDLKVEYCFKTALIDIWRILVLRKPLRPGADRPATDAGEVADAAVEPQPYQLARAH